MKLHPLRAAVALTAALTTAAAPLLAAAQTSYEFKQYTPRLVVDGPGAGSGPLPDAGGGIKPQEPPAPQPGLRLSTGAIHFGNVATHTTETRQVLVSNPGTGALSFTAAPAVSGDAAFAAGLTSCGASLAAGADCLAEATFSPTATGTFNGMLAFTSALANSPHEVTLQGTAFNPVSLASTTLPAGMVGQAYNYDFKQLLSVSNEASPDKALTSWEGSGTLPAGMSFNASTGVLSGTPSVVNPGASYTVTGTYKNNQGQQVYTIKVGEAVLEAVQIAVGTYHTCAVTAAGGVKCWGHNGSSQLGDGTTTNRSTPVAVQGLDSGVRSVAAGSVHTCAVTTEGALKCWGYNAYGQLGDGTTTQRSTPVVVFYSGMQSVAAGEVHACAVTSDGAVKCWGDNGNGQLGDGTTTNRSTPVAVAGLASGVQSVAAGMYHACAVAAGGALKCWGQNAYGQLGDGTTTGRSAPVAVQGLASGVQSVAAGYAHTCAVATGGALKCWGNNNYGHLGDGTYTSRSAPVAVVGLASGVQSAAAGLYHTCAVTAGGELKCWGSNPDGQLGDGTTVNKTTPVQVSGLTAGVTAVATYQNHTCAMTTGGALKCWGYNYYGQVGDGTTTRRNAPVNVLP